MASPAKIDFPPGHPWRRARPLLAALFLDSVPPLPVVPSGYHTGHHGVSFPTGDRAACQLRLNGPEVLWKKDATVFRKAHS